MTSDQQTGRPRRVAVLGAGPVGLEAALAAVDEGYDVTVFEAADRPAANVRDWGHVRLFTPWSMNVSPRMRVHLKGLEEGLDEEPGEGLGNEPEVDAQEAPTGHELADRVLDPLWNGPALADRLRLGSRVVAVGREGALKHEEIAAPERGRRPFRILLRDASGKEWVERADIVLDCTGKYGHPNTLGDGGIPAPGESALGDRIRFRIPDLEREGEEWSGRTILLAGAGHSAQTAARDLAELSGGTDTRVIWLVRKPEPDWGAVENDPLPARKALTESARALADGAAPSIEVITGSAVDRVERENGHVRVHLGGAEGAGTELRVDRILALTGGVGDHALYRQLQVHECYATSGPMKLSAALLGAGGDGGDCLDQESHGVDTLRNPEPNFFILGDKSYGRNNTFLMRVGWQQVDEVFGALRES